MKITLIPGKEDEAPRQVQVPAIHNLLFVQIPDNEQQLLQTLKECMVPVSVFRHPGSDKYSPIPDSEIVELRMLCDPQYSTPIYLEPNEAEEMIGKEVRVIHGPFKGSIGKLVRKRKQFYFLKMITGLGVMVHISRWYCEPIQ